MSIMTQREEIDRIIEINVIKQLQRIQVAVFICGRTNPETIAEWLVAGRRDLAAHPTDGQARKGLSAGVQGFRPEDAVVTKCTLFWIWVTDTHPYGSNHGCPIVWIFLGQCTKQVEEIVRNCIFPLEKVEGVEAVLRMLSLFTTMTRRSLGQMIFSLSPGTGRLRRQRSSRMHSTVVAPRSVKR